jgi:hypothetical protein
MAISTYTELQTAVSDYLARSDLTAYVPNFIALAESRMNRVLRVRDMETDASITMTAGSGPLPSGYLEWLAATWNGTTDQDLRYVEPNSEEWRYRYRPGGNPMVFTILGSNIKIKPVVTGNLSMTYYMAIPALASNSTNWLLTRSPDVYLNYSLAEAYIFIKDPTTAKDFMSLANEESNRMVTDSDSNKVARRPSRKAELEDIATAGGPGTVGQ